MRIKCHNRPDEQSDKHEEHVLLSFLRMNKWLMIRKNTNRVEEKMEELSFYHLILCFDENEKQICSSACEFSIVFLLVSSTTFYVCVKMDFFEEQKYSDQWEKKKRKTKRWQRKMGKERKKESDLRLCCWFCFYRCWPKNCKPLKITQKWLFFLRKWEVNLSRVL